jgi:cytochrome c oxidase subunit 2
MRKLGLWMALSAFAPLAFADEFNMRPGVTEISRSIYDLHMFMFIICVLIGVVVFGAMFVSILLHRKSRGAEPARFHENTTLEVVWTVIPFLILMGMAVPATRTLVEMYDTGGEDMVVQVVGYQWKWEYKYPDDETGTTPVSYFSTLSTPRDQIENRSAKTDTYLLEVDEPLVIPTGRKVRFLVTSNDVIHAFWVPDFGIKRDAIPGFVNDIWTVVDEPGIYRGQCTELCGKDHGYMPIVVKAVAPEEYETWYEDKAAAMAERQQWVDREWTPDELYAAGEEIYGKFCASCHQPNGQGVPPVFPALAGSELITQGTQEDHIRIVYDGKAGTAMASFANQLNAGELAAVIHYERHAWGNDTGDVTLPQDILDYAEK